MPGVEEGAVQIRISSHISNGNITHNRLPFNLRTIVCESPVHSVASFVRFLQRTLTGRPKIVCIYTVIANRTAFWETTRKTLSGNWVDYVLENTCVSLSQIDAWMKAVRGLDLISKRFPIYFGMGIFHNLYSMKSNTNKHIKYGQGQSIRIASELRSILRKALHLSIKNFTANTLYNVITVAVVLKSRTYRRLFLNS